MPRPGTPSTSIGSPARRPDHAVARSYFCSRASGFAVRFFTTAPSNSTVHPSPRHLRPTLLSWSRPRSVFLLRALQPLNSARDDFAIRPLIRLLNLHPMPRPKEPLSIDRLNCCSQRSSEVSGLENLPLDFYRKPAKNLRKTGRCRALLTFPVSRDSRHSPRRRLTGTSRWKIRMNRSRS